nr:hypothetical protein CFP56_13223 [Quercus suber]
MSLTVAISKLWLQSSLGVIPACRKERSGILRFNFNIFDNFVWSMSSDAPSNGKSALQSIPLAFRARPHSPGFISGQHA